MLFIACIALYAESITDSVNVPANVGCGRTAIARRSVHLEKGSKVIDFTFEPAVNNELTGHPHNGTGDGIAWAVLITTFTYDTATLEYSYTRDEHTATTQCSKHEEK